MIYVGMLPPLTVGDRSGGIQPIDLTAESLDSRVTYTGPAHIYHDADGKLILSGANQWPVETLNGVTGRHEPERASQNLLPDTDFSSTNGTGAWTKSPGTTVNIADSSLGYKVAEITPAATNIALYNEASASWLISPTAAETPTEWKELTYKATNGVAGILRWYVARASSTQYLYGKTVSVPAGDVVASVFRKQDSDSIDSALAQVETGTNRTSPIINGSEETNTRAASSVTINEPLASKATLNLTDGSTIELSPVDGVFTIPVSTMDWRTRLIKEVTFE